MVICKSDNNCVFAYTRTSKENTIFAILNFSDKEATISPKLNGKVTLLINTDWELFGGKTVKSIKRGVPQVIPPFTGILFTYQKSTASK